jgi:hypothetical protein
LHIKYYKQMKDKWYKHGSFSREPVRGWHRGTGSHEAVTSIGREAAPTLLLERQSRQGESSITADRFILLGDWHDSFAAII